MKAFIFNIQRFCLSDGPGIRTTVFFKGCPLRCVWCHNPESQLPARQLMYYESKCTGCGRCLAVCSNRRRDPEDPARILIDRDLCTGCGKCVDVCFANANAFAGYEEDAEKIMETVLLDKIFYGTGGGITLSGGEPSMQPDAALYLLRRAKEEGLSAVMETCGVGSSEFYEKAADLGTVFYYDLKSGIPEKHREFTGAPLSRVLETLDLLIGKRAEIVLRLPLIPGMNDSDEDLMALAGLIREREQGISHAEIMKYHILGSSKSRALGKKYEAPKENAGKEDAARWLEFLRKYGTERTVISE
ncbi:MAG: glycyl-radical enzyme activating protein [Lachnospiraceae bacterium]|nr:glycyl-radical enzyme activating protein [Lachnospiraceae bacterium]